MGGVAAAIGGIAGSVIPGVGTGIGAAVGGAIGNVIEGDRAASAGQNSANAAYGAASAERQQAMRAAEPTPEELANLDRATQALERDISAKEELIKSADPALMEAGRQALQLLQGQEAKTLDPVKRQRAEQRTKLQDTLRSRLGSGYENSSAGSRALNDFDTQTSDLLNNAQQQSLNQLLGTAYATRNIASITGSSQALAGIRDPLAQRRLNAAIGAKSAADSYDPFVGDAARARQGQNTIRDIVGIGTAIGSGESGFAGLYNGGQPQPKYVYDPMTGKKLE